MIPTDDTPCAEVLRHLDDYLDRELNADDQRLIEAHIKSCNPCAIRFENEKKTLQKLRDIAQSSEVPDDLVQNVLKRIVQDD